MKDPRIKHTLILGCLLTVAAPIALLASYYQARAEMTHLGAPEYTWQYAQQDVWAIFISFLLGGLTLGIHFCLKRNLKYSGTVWVLLLSLLMINQIMNMIRGPHMVIFLWILLLTYFLRNAVIYLRKDMLNHSI
ncbi:MAG: hypothetical protein AAF571_12680 [Verrucomicrobiota bacterium]